MSYDVVKADINKDSDLIIEFWNKNNEKKLDDKYAWMYRSNPDGEASTWLVRYSETAEVVGMASVFPRRFCFRDKTFIAGIQGDFFVNSKHRSFGPALMLIRQLSASLEELDYDFLFGFPNKKAEPIFRRAGYTQLGETNKYTRLFNINRLLSDRMHIPESLVQLAGPIINMMVNLSYPDAWIFNLGRFKTEVTNRVKYDIDNLSKLYHQSTFATCKTKEYLSWKYENDPDDKNMFFVLLRKDSVVGYVVFCIEENQFVYIRDIIHNHDNATMIALLALFFKEMRRTKCEYAYAQIYKKSNLLLTTNNLDFTVSKQGGKVVYLINKNKVTKNELESLIKSGYFSLFKSDEDS